MHKDLKNGWRAKVGTYKYGKVEAATKSKYDNPKNEQKIKVTNMVNGKSSIFRKWKSRGDKLCLKKWFQQFLL